VASPGTTASQLDSAVYKKNHQPRLYGRSEWRRNCASYYGSLYPNCTSDSPGPHGACVSVPLTVRTWSGLRFLHRSFHFPSYLSPARVSQCMGSIPTRRKNESVSLPRLLSQSGALRTAQVSLQSTCRLKPATRKAERAGDSCWLPGMISRMLSASKMRNRTSAGSRDHAIPMDLKRETLAMA
jgi:hypothetical protein